MTTTDMEMRLLEDTIGGGGRLHLPDDGVHRVCYVVHGEVSTGAATFRDDEAAYLRSGATLTAGAGGVTLWRYELTPAGTAPTSVQMPSGATREKLRQRLAWPVADAMLMRADSVSFPPGGCAFLHTHQGPGIRCLIDGGIRIDATGHSASFGPGGAWFESGPDPVFAQAAADRPSRFIRVMVLPARLKGQSSISYVNEADRAKPKTQKYKGYVDELLVS